MAAPIAYRAHMLMSLNLTKYFQLGSVQNAFSNIPRIISIVGMPSQRLCTQSQSDKPEQEKEATANESEKTSPESRYVQQFNPELIRKLTAKMDGDMPLDSMPNPFEKKYRRCLLCEKNVNLEWKNVRLLSQFVSPFTGRIYGRHITGLCIPMQKRVARLIKRARILGYMAIMNKDPHYLQDPKLFDPFRPQQK